MIPLNFTNSVTLSGLIHHLSRKKEQSYFPFSVRQDTTLDGTPRKDFLSARAFPKDLQDKLKSLAENTPVLVHGILRSSKGSGELFLDVTEAEALGELTHPENTVTLSGATHVIKAQNEGVTGAGQYIRFAVKQEDPVKGRDFIVVRVFDDGLKEILAEKSDNDPVKVEGTLRSSRGSGVNYVRCSEIE